MADFVTSAFHASQLLGGPCRLARRLGVEPDQLYRWIAGQDLPTEGARRELQRKIRVALLDEPALEPAHRRHSDRCADSVILAQ